MPGGFIYWRLLSFDPVAAKLIVCGDKPGINVDYEKVDSVLVDQLCLYISTLASIYHKPAASFIGGFKARKLIESPVLIERLDYNGKVYVHTIV